MNNYLVTFMASGLIWLMFGGLIILWLKDNELKDKKAGRAFLALLLVWGLTELIKFVFPTLRPFELYSTNVLTLTVPSDGAFPSAHAALAFSIATSIQKHNRKLGIIFFTAALLVAAGRMLANVHYLLDVAVGAILGVAITLALTVRMKT